MHTRLGWIDLALVGMAAIWGVNAVVVKLAYAQIAPAGFMSLRFIIAPILFALILAFSAQISDISGRDWLFLAAAGVAGTTLYQPFFLFGLLFSDVADAVLIIATTPAFVAVLNRALGREYLGLRGWLGILIAFSGVALSISGNRDLLFSSQMLIGYVLVLLSNLSWASYVVLAAPLMRRHSPLNVTALSMIIGAIPLVLLGAPSIMTQNWGAVDWHGWGYVLFSSVFGVVVAFVIWNLAVQKIGGGPTAIYMNLTPVIAILAALVLLGREITLLKVIGMAVILLGVNLVRTSKFTRRSATLISS